MKRIKVVSSLLMIVLSPIILGGCDSGDINDPVVRGQVDTVCGGNWGDVTCGGRIKGEIAWPF